MLPIFKVTSPDFFWTASSPLSLEVPLQCLPVDAYSVPSSPPYFFFVREWENPFPMDGNADVDRPADLENSSESTVDEGLDLPDGHFGRPPGFCSIQQH